MALDPSIKSVLIIGSGPIIIGQACEFDYSGSQAALALKEEGIRVALINSNPATIMTDPVTADDVYLLPLEKESIIPDPEKQKIDAVLPTMGGQTGLNLATECQKAGIWAKYGVRIIGANMEAIELAEDREAFRALAVSLDIDVPAPTGQFLPQRHGDRPAHRLSTGNPGLLYPGWHGRRFCGRGKGLRRIAQTRPGRQPGTRGADRGEHFLAGKEYELEVMRDLAGNKIVVCSVENMDPTGIHTGDSITVAPALTLPDVQMQQMRNASFDILEALGEAGREGALPAAVMCSFLSSQKQDA